MTLSFESGVLSTLEPESGIQCFQLETQFLKSLHPCGSEQKRLSNVAVDAVFDSVSIATTFREDLMKVRSKPVQADRPRGAYSLKLSFFLPRLFESSLLSKF